MVVTSGAVLTPCWTQQERRSTSFHRNGPPVSAPLPRLIPRTRLRVQHAAHLKEERAGRCRAANFRLSFSPSKLVLLVDNAKSYSPG